MVRSKILENKNVIEYDIIIPCQGEKDYENVDYIFQNLKDHVVLFLL
jgi:hypothetical protein